MPWRDGPLAAGDQPCVETWDSVTSGDSVMWKQGWPETQQDPRILKEREWMDAMALSCSVKRPRKLMGSF